MGNNKAYEIWEHTIVTIYDSGALTLSVLDTLSEFWRGTDIDHGGWQGLTSQDGFEADEIALLLVKPELRAKINKEEALADEEELLIEFWDMSHKRWGWC